MSTLEFGMTTLWFGIRDLLSPPKSILREADIRPELHVLDYGCGPGSYALAAAELVGQAGKVYAADANALAVQRVREIASKKGMRNIETIHTDCATGLASESVDVALLYDTYHDLANPEDVLGELHRVLKPNAILSFSDHHLREDDILARVVGGGLFSLSSKGRKTYSFLKAV